MVLFDQQLRILTANPAATDAFGHKPAALVGKPIFANLKDLPSETLSALSELLRGERRSLTFETQAQHGDERRATEMTLQRVNHHEPLFAMHITDRSEQRTIEQAHEQATRLDALLGSISANFLESRWETVDEDITRAMGRIARVLKLDVLQLRDTALAAGESTLVNEWVAPARPSTPDDARTLPLDSPVLTDLFSSTQPTTGTVDQLELSRALLASTAADAVAFVPVAVGRFQAATVLAVASNRRTWSDAELASLTTFANLATQLRARTTVEAASRQRLSVEDLVRRVAATLIDATPTTGGARSREALAALGAFFDVRRVMRWRFDQTVHRIAVTEAWSGEETQGLGHRVRDFAVVPGSGLADVVALPEPVGHVYNSHELFPPDGRDQLTEGSYLLVPLVTGGATTGALVFEREPGAAWHELEIRSLETIAALVGQLDARLEAERYLASSFSQAPVGILVTDVDNQIVSTNPSFARFLGVDEDHLIGNGLGDYIDAKDSWLDDAADGHKGELAFFRPDHRPVFGRVNSVRIPSPDGVAEHVLSYIEDVTRARRNRERLEFQANHDELTGLANRRVFLDELGLCLGTPSAPDDAAVLMIDLDRFKVVNDSLGHSVGDQILGTVADRLRLAVREADLVARLGGDEFVVLLRGPVGEMEAVSVAQRVIELLKEPIRAGIHEVFVTGSVGIAFPSAEDTANEDVLRHADAAMYQAKQRGRHRYEIFDESSREAVANRIETEGQLRRALEYGELEVYYQPEYDLITNKIVGAESLVRWNHPKDGVLTAGAFIGIAEDTGLVVDIGSFVLTEACRQGAEWNSRRAEPLVIRVNLSARQLERETIVAEVAEALSESGLPAEQLCLEITETAIMTDVEESLRLLSELRALGVHLAIDDFGTGFSSLAYLKRFPVDILKIDQAFIRNLQDDETDEAIVLSIIKLAEALDLAVVAEGIEEPEHREKLVEMGCRRGQGFGLARPGPVSVIAELLDLMPASARSY